MVNNLDFLCHNLWCSVRVVDGLPRAGSHYNLGTSRGPDKIGSRAGPDPARGPRLAHGWSTIMELELLMCRFIRSLREGDFPLYVQVCDELCAWFHVMDHTNYA